MNPLEQFEIKEFFYFLLLLPGLIKFISYLAKALSLGSRLTANMTDKNLSFSLVKLLLLSFSLVILLLLSIFNQFCQDYSYFEPLIASNLITKLSIFPGLSLKFSTKNDNTDAVSDLDLDQKDKLKTWLISNKPAKVYLNSAESKDIILKDNNGLSGIYLWYNNVNNNYYIGSAINLKMRMSSYFNPNYLVKDNFKIQRALIKYGHDKFSLYILEYTSSNDLVTREQYFINTLSPYYNILKIAYSSLGFIHSEESRKLLSVINTGKKHSEEALAKMQGRILSEETRKSMSISKTGINNPFFGKSHSLETLQKVSNSLKGKNHPRFGKFGGDNPISKKVYVYELNEPLPILIFNSQSEAAVYFNSNNSTISRYVISGKLYLKRYILSPTLRD